MDEKIENLIFAFDLGFSDMYVNESVRFDTFRNKEKQLFEVRNLIEVDSILNHAVFAKLGEQHLGSQLWLESETDLKASIYLVLGGYYRQAAATLRNWLEITLTGVYFNQYYRGPNSRYNQWRAGARQSPKWPHLLDSVFRRAAFAAADTKTNLRQALNNLYPELSYFVHSRGIEIYDLQNGRDNVPRYIEHSFDLWFSLAKRTSSAISLVLIIEYGSELRAYLQVSSGESRRLKESLSAEAIDDPLVKTFLASLTGQ